MEFDTICVGRRRGYSCESDRIPIYLSNIYNGEYFYSRYGNPNKTELEERLKLLYGRENKLCTVYPSGMSAIATLINYIKEQYDKPTILTPYDLYEEIREQIKYCDGVNFIQCDRDLIVENITDATSLVLLESISNPLLQPYDIKRICRNKHHAIVAVDNTILTSYFYNPFNDGADIIIESLGKNTCGFGDVMAGAIWGIPQSRYSILCGDMVSPLSCYLLQRSLPTLPIRMEKITFNASKVYEFIKRYTDNVLWYGKGGLITFSFCNKHIHQIILSSLTIVVNGMAFGYEETTIQAKYDGYGTIFQYPYNVHLRLSIGLENWKDIINDLSNAFEKAGLKCRKKK